MHNQDTAVVLSVKQFNWYEGISSRKCLKYAISLARSSAPFSSSLGMVSVFRGVYIDFSSREELYPRGLFVL